MCICSCVTLFSTSIMFSLRVSASRVIILVITEIRASALSTMGQVVQCMKEAAEPYLHEWMPLVLEALGSPETTIQRSATFVAGAFIHGGGLSG